MSLGMVIKSPEGLVLAAESRVTLEVHKNGSANTIFNNFDNATKLFSLSQPHHHIGVVTYGQAAIGQRTAHSFVPEFESTLSDKLDSVLDYANSISAFFMQQWYNVMPRPYIGPDMTFIVAGFNNGEPHGRIYLINLPSSPAPVEQSPGMGSFGITWGGQREIVDRLLMGYDAQILNTIYSELKPNPSQIAKINTLLQQKHQLQIPLDVMALQDCISLARLFISTTINSQELTIGLRGCGGPIDIAVIQRGKDLSFVQRKELK
jgi:hypothetical protein